jgi:hypothetical protein
MNRRDRDHTLRQDSEGDKTVPEGKILSHHRFLKPRIRYLLPIVMIAVLAVCAATIPPRIRFFELAAFVGLAYIAISSLVSVCEITVTTKGLIIYRLLLPLRFIPWDAIDRVIVLSREGASDDYAIEIATIGIYEGLSPLNRLPGILYGQGTRQTIIATPDALEDYDRLIENLSEYCTIIRP